MIDGIKKTVLSEIPEDWEVVNIEDVASICTGGKDTQNKVEDGEFPFYVRSNTIERINSSSFDGEAVLTSGDGVGVGKIYHYVNGKFDYHQRVYNIHNFNSGLIGRFFYYYFSQHFYKRVKRYSAKNSVDSVRMEMISRMEIPLPPLPEQQKIAEILSTVDEKIEVIGEQIIQTQELKRGLMQRLLTKGIGHTRFKGSPLGMIPDCWKEVKIKEIGTVKGGKRLPNGKKLVKENTGFPYIKAGDLKKGTVLTDNLEYLSPEIQRKIRNYTISSADTYITIVGAYIGDTGTIPESLDSANLTENAAKICNLKDINNRYLAFFLGSELGKAQIKSAIGTGAQPKLALKRLQEFNLPLPSIQEQLQIVAILSTIDEKLVIQQSKKQQYQELKKGLMQQLLTGKIRVTNLLTKAVPA